MFFFIHIDNDIDLAAVRLPPLGGQHRRVIAEPGDLHDGIVARRGELADEDLFDFQETS